MKMEGKRECKQIHYWIFFSRTIGWVLKVLMVFGTPVFLLLMVMYFWEVSFLSEMYKTILRGDLNLINRLEHIVEVFIEQVRQLRVEGKSIGNIMTLLGLGMTCMMFAQVVYNRHRDFVISLPRNRIQSIGISIDERMNFLQLAEYDDVIEMDTILRCEFRSAFSAYYVGLPYRLFIKLDRRREGKGVSTERLKIGNVIFLNNSSVGDGENNPVSNQNDLVMLISSSQSKLLGQYCSKSDTDQDSSLHIVLDSVWTIKILPCISRLMEAVYLRQYLVLEKRKKGSSYMIASSIHKKAPRCSGYLIMQVLKKIMKKTAVCIDMAMISALKISYRKCN